MGSLPYIMPKCDICGREETGLETKCVPWLLGTDDVFCKRCFFIWYDGCTSREEIKRCSLAGYDYWRPE